MTRGKRRRFFAFRQKLSLALSLGLSVGLAGLSPVIAATATQEPAEMSEKAKEVLDGFTRTGETKSCLGLRQISEIRPLDDRHFLVRTGLTNYYLNIVSKGCRGAARFNNRLQYTTSIGRLCRNEIIRVVDNSSGILAGSCGLGDFERLEKKADAPSE